MANLNKVFLMGNLTKDPELRYTPNGTAVVNLRLAVNRKFKDRVSNELKNDVCYVTAVVWDKQAETCNQYLHKGKPVFVEGRLQSRSWEDANQQKRSVLEVRAERVQFLGSPGQSGAKGASTFAEPAQSAPAVLGESEHQESDWPEEEVKDEAA